MPQYSSIRQLLVEGKNDQHVVWALCEQHGIEETFEVIVPSESGSTADGIDALLVGIPGRLKQPDFEVLGIVVDADENIQGRWESVMNRLDESGYQNLPDIPASGGFISSPSDMPKVGVWLMPNNRLTGILEDFVAYLIPNDDQLKPITQKYVESVEEKGLNNYPAQQSSKAFIHSWLACQETPGMPMGQAITAHALNYNADLANNFVDWLNQLFS